MGDAYCEHSLICDCVLPLSVLPLPQRWRWLSRPGERSAFSPPSTRRVSFSPITNNTYNHASIISQIIEKSFIFISPAEIPPHPQVKIELYRSTKDGIRAALELAFIVNLIASIRQEVIDVLESKDRLKRLFSAESYVDFLNFSLSAIQARERE